MRLERVAVIGVGLIGGSFALALKQAKACGRVIGVGRSQSNLKEALARGVIDAMESDPGAAARGAQLVLIAAPVAQFPSILRSLGRELAPGTVVTDAGSTKRDVVDAARKALGAKSGQFVPAHPIAGAERSGAAAAHAELFRGRRVVLTPLEENAPAHLDLVRAAWATCGARLSEMDPDEHDAVLATVSHLPHVLAYALVHEVAQRPDAQQLFSYAAGGFRDFTRIASSHPEMWRDICAANRDRLEEEISRFSAKLEDLRRLLKDPASLEKVFAEARAARQRWLDGKFEA